MADELLKFVYPSDRQFASIRILSLLAVLAKPEEGQCSVLLSTETKSAKICVTASLLSAHWKIGDKWWY